MLPRLYLLSWRHVSRAVRHDDKSQMTKSNKFEPGPGFVNICMYIIVYIILSIIYMYILMYLHGFYVHVLCAYRYI